MKLTEFHAKISSCKVKLKNGQKVTLTFRKFTLADVAWLQDELSDKDYDDLNALKISVLSKIIWHQLSKESKEFFDDVTIEVHDESNGGHNTVNLLGYDKLTHTLNNQSELMNLFATYTEVRENNSFAPDQKKKSKIPLLRKISSLLTGRKYTTK